MQRNGTIKVRLPYPVKVGFITFSIGRKIGFAFNQRALFNLLENNKIDLPNHKEWLKNTPKNIVLVETLYGAAQSYCEGLRQKDNFTKKGLSRALNEADETTMTEIIECWNKSEQFGYKKMPGKKKAVRQ